eukprot:GHVO01012962.1.p1 GENE.GHVO01012962.1~~GHVO01012962.1.p1  ORF type:complete len:383 (+),score=117.33 GHVO01012962.1:410-1558(+)
MAHPFRGGVSHAHMMYSDSMAGHRPSDDGSGSSTPAGRSRRGSEMPGGGGHGTSLAHMGGEGGQQMQASPMYVRNLSMGSYGKGTGGQQGMIPPGMDERMMKGIPPPGRPMRPRPGYGADQSLITSQQRMPQQLDPSCLSGSGGLPPPNVSQFNNMSQFNNVQNDSTRDRLTQLLASQQGGTGNSGFFHTAQNNVQDFRQYYTALPPPTQHGRTLPASPNDLPPVPSSNYGGRHYAFTADQSGRPRLPTTGGGQTNPNPHMDTYGRKYVGGSLGQQGGGGLGQQGGGGLGHQGGGLGHPGGGLGHPGGPSPGLFENLASGSPRRFPNEWRGPPPHDGIIQQSMGGGNPMQPPQNGQRPPHQYQFSGHNNMQQQQQQRPPPQH